MDILRAVDQYLFLVINKGLANPQSDIIFSTASDLFEYPWVQWGILPLIMGLWVWKRHAAGALQIFIVVLSILITDGVCHHILKPAFEHPRPKVMRLNPDIKSVSGSSTYGFPSNHAANAFVSARLLSYFFPGSSMLFYFLATLIAFSRVYVGVHFPSDVIGGAIIGLIMGSAVIRGFNYAIIRWKTRKKKKGLRIRMRPRYKS